jgi:hypothetical protein
MKEHKGWKPGQNFGEMQEPVIETTAPLAEPAKPSKKLICVKEAIMPGRGHFKPGDVIEDPALIEAIGQNHPFFISGDDVPESTQAAESNQEGN